MKKIISLIPVLFLLLFVYDSVPTHKGEAEESIKKHYLKEYNGFLQFPHSFIIGDETSDIKKDDKGYYYTMCPSKPQPMVVHVTIYPNAIKSILK